MVGECRANVFESGQSRVANVGECIESGQISKMAILASTRIRQNWQIFGEYSNLEFDKFAGEWTLLNYYFFFRITSLPRKLSNDVGDERREKFATTTTMRMMTTSTSRRNSRNSALQRTVRFQVRFRYIRFGLGYVRLGKLRLGLG